MRDTIRIADLRVSKLAVAILRYLLPPTLAWALMQRRHNESAAVDAAAKLGADAARIVIEAKEGAQTLRRWTFVIAGLTFVNTGFVIYSVIK
jgi:hypothetical protein